MEKNKEMLNKLTEIVKKELKKEGYRILAIKEVTTEDTGHFGIGFQSIPDTKEH